MRKRVLIIDDDRELCEELSELLKEEGFEVAYALKPSEGKALLFSGSFDVLLLDFRMPQMDGVEFLGMMRGKTKGLKIFLMSGSLHVRTLLEEMGCADLVAGVLSKPFEIDKFLQALQ